MKHLLKTATILSLLLTTFSCSKNEINQDISFEIDEYRQVAIDYEILELLNQHRITKGLQPLQLLNVISCVAFEHNKYMISKDEISHNNFGDRCQKIRATTAAITISENLGYGYTSAASVVNAWLNSSEHLVNIESPIFTHIGISSVTDSSDTYFYTNIFVNIQN